ncbi:MAG: hypothetical protein PHW73_00925 [Atribacterota bacterium]|nr:hypothetical protein [Atribacterota bacterium]
MKQILLKETHVPLFMACSCHEEPELNYNLYYGYPRILVEVADSYDSDELDYLRNNKFLFKEVELINGEKDLLIVVDILDKDYLENKSDIEIFDGIMEILDKMADWHINEIEDIEKYK